MVSISSLLANSDQQPSIEMDLDLDVLDVTAQKSTKVSLLSMINSDEVKPQQSNTPLHLKPISFADILNQGPTKEEAKPKARKKPAKEDPKPKKKRKTKAQKEKEEANALKENASVEKLEEPAKEVKEKNENPYTKVVKPIAVKETSSQAVVVKPGKEMKKSNLSKLLNSDEDRGVIEILDEEDDDEEEEVDVDAEEDVDDEDYETYECEPKKEIPLVVEVELQKADATGSKNGQVIINVMKMAEEKYGYKTIHPNANFALDGLRDDLFDEDMEGPIAPVENNELLKEHKKHQLKLQKEQEQKLQQQLELLQAQNDDAEALRKLQEMITKNNRKIGKYDYEDPFIDDTEMYWEETQAVTRDGFFVYWGPLVEEGNRLVAKKGTKSKSKAKGKGGKKVTK